MHVQDIMTTEVATVAPELNAEEAWRQMRSARTRHLVVCSEGRIAGVLSDRDLGGVNGTVVRAGKRVADLMTPYVIIAAPEMRLRDAARIMRINSLSCLPVVDGKTLIGIITTSDVLELVGDATTTRRIRPMRRRIMRT